MKKLMTLFATSVCFILTACSAPAHYDYSAYKASNPRSILVVMPTDTTNEVKAGAAVLANATAPLAEAGYYVFPVALVNDTFKFNGVTQAQEIHNVSAKKLYEIFGADAVLYINVEDYGVQYQVIDSVTKVSLTGKLVDLRNGKALWEGKGYADSTNSGGNVNTGNVFGNLIAVAIKQIAKSVSDEGYKISAFADADLLATGRNGGLLYGPRHPQYGNDPQLKR